MKRKGKVLATVIGAMLIALSSGLGAAEKADGQCAKSATQCREAGRDEGGTDLAPLKKWFFELTGLPDSQRGPSLSHARPAAERPLPSRHSWPMFGEGMGFLGQRLSSRLLNLLGWFGAP